MLVLRIPKPREIPEPTWALIGVPGEQTNTWTWTQIEKTGCGCGDMIEHPSRIPISAITRAFIAPERLSRHSQSTPPGYPIPRSAIWMLNSHCHVLLLVIKLLMSMLYEVSRGRIALSVRGMCSKCSQ